jgi:dTDP-4-dehydrorhamnose reductase
MNRKIMLLGKAGQIGGDLSPLLQRLGTVASFGRAELNLEKPEAIRQAIRAVQPDVIVNAAAYTAVDKAESEESLARAINARAPATIAQEAKQTGALLVHYSTDYVFDGAKRSPYLEDDPTNPRSVYGRTKLEGELAIRESGVSHLILRTAWVYAREGRNFLRTILRLAAERDELKVVSDQIGAPTWSHEIAAATLEVLSQILRGSAGTALRSDHLGTFHVTAAGQASWFDFARAILEEAKGVSQDASWYLSATSGRPLLARRLVPISTSEYPVQAARPAYSVLSNARLADTFGVRLPDWRSSLQDLFSTE